MTSVGILIIPHIIPREEGRVAIIIALFERPLFDLIIGNWCVDCLDAQGWPAGLFIFVTFLPLVMLF